MKWPRGRYNGSRIVGLRFRVVIDVTYWHWWPQYLRYANAVRWLCVLVGLEAEYE